MTSSLPSVPLIVRPMRRADARDVARMMRELAAFHGDKSFSTADDFITYCMGAKKIGTVFIAQQDKILVGFALFYDCMNFVEGNISRKLDLLCVNEKFQRQGIGKALIARIAQDCIKKKVARIQIGAHAKNKTAQKFYSKLGLLGQSKKRLSYIAAHKDFRRLAKAFP